ncbi:MAG: hypothetical protein IPJ47_22900 [Anaerolineales bacterium]|nr:hypothetical protein [Anaerolineales bacterium]
MITRASAAGIVKWACPYEARVFNWEAFEGENPYVPQWGELVRNAVCVACRRNAPSATNALTAGWN